MKIFKNQITFCFLSGILLTFSWLLLPELIFIAFVPLLLLEKKSAHKPGVEMFFYSLFTFGMWNVLSAWWIGYATLTGAALLLGFNSFLQALVFWVFRIIKKGLGLKRNFILAAIWLTFEYLYLRFEISWPWFNIGNVFGDSVSNIQWYEFTGTLGGTFWILLINIMIAELASDYSERREVKPVKIGIVSAILIFPVLISLFLYYKYEEKIQPVNVTVIQPNINPYTEKFKASPWKQLDIILNEAQKKGSARVDYYVAPETAIVGHVLLNAPETNDAVHSIRNFLKDHPGSKFIIGAETEKRYSDNDNIPYTARKSTQNYWYNRFNSALQIDTSAAIQVYHKSQLVLGVEKMPFSKYFRFPEHLSFQIGGTSGELGYQDKRTLFSSPGGNVAPVICYESVYGQYVTEYVRAGADLLFVITNDGWWKISDGLRQHLNISRLRAVETRRSVARSANTGISALINQRGDLIKTLEGGIRGSITGILNSNPRVTFYTKYGDYIGKTALYFSLLLLLYWAFQKQNKKINHDLNK